MLRECRDPRSRFVYHFSSGPGPVNRRQGSPDNQRGYQEMMATILQLIILAMVFQGVLAVLNSILDAVGVNGILGSIPVVGSNLNLIWAYLFVAISGIGGWGHGASTEILGMGEFGMDVGSALAITAFIPVKDAVLSALSKGVAR